MSIPYFVYSWEYPAEILFIWIDFWIDNSGGK